MNKVLVTIGVLLVTVLAVLFAAPALIDWSRYRSTFEAEATRLLGRHVRVGDQVQLRLLPTPYISFDNVRVADASGRFDTPLLRMDSFRMQLSTSALLSGALVAQDVELKAPTLRLAIGSDGKGNWEGLLPALKSKDALGRPANAKDGASAAPGFAISTVRMTHGVVELLGASEGQRWRFEEVAGDIDAAGAEGPFRFKGVYQQDGKPADLRLSVGRDGAAGKLRLKASTRGMDPANASYTFDGVVDTQDGQTTLSGDLEGKIPFPPGAGLDLKSKLSANSDHAKFDEIEIAIEAAGRPQRLTGSASIGLTAEASSDAVLKSTWLNFDQFARTTAGSEAAKPTPKDSLQAIFALANGLPGLTGKAHLQLAVEEALLGGGPVAAVTLSASRNPNGFTIDSLTAKLPGQSLLAASGDVNTLGAPHFDGQVRLWGANLPAMANWAAPSLQLKDASGASPYLIDTEIAVDAARFSAEKLRAEVSGTTVSGAIRYVASPQSLSLTIDSNRLDLARDFDSPINLAALIGLTAAPAEPAAGGFDLKSLLAGDTYLDLRIGRLLTAQGALHDVSAKLDRSNGRLNIPGIDLATDNGFTLHVEGALQVKDEQGQGQLRLLLAAPSPESAFTAMKIAGLADSPAAAQKSLAALTPLTLAGTVELGGKSSTSETLALDGSAAGSRLRVQLRRDSGESDWLSGQVDAAADLSNPDAERLLAQIARGLDQVLAPAIPGPAALGDGESGAAPGTLSLRLSGIPEDGLATRIGLATGAIDATFNGRTSYGADAVLTADGALSVAAKDGNRLAHLAGLSRFVPDQSGDVKLSGRLHRDAGALVLSDAVVAVAGAQSSGDVKLLSSGPRLRLEANLQSSTLRLDRWLSLLTTAGGGTAAARDSADGGPWPDRTFDFDLTQAADAKITASAKELVLANGYRLDDARLTAESSPGKMAVGLAAGRGLQGDWAGRLMLEKAPAGAVMHLEASLDKARLDQLAGQQGALPRPEGELALKVALDGRGLTPRDLIGATTGKGTFAISEGSFAGFSSNSVDAVARITLADSAASSAEALSRRLLEASKTGAFAFRGAKGNLTVADGAIRFDKLLVDSAQSQLEIANRIDLTKLQVASTWRLQPKPVQPGKSPLPPVQFAYQGALADLTRVQPAIEFADLTRDLEARRLLGEPEQSAGIWPVEGAASGAAEAENTPPVPAPLPAADLKAAETTEPGQAAALPGAMAATPSAPSTGPIIGNPSATAAATPVPDTLTPAVDTAVKRTQPRPHKKKSSWASSLLQGLFGN